MNHPKLIGLSLALGLAFELFLIFIGAIGIFVLGDNGHVPNVLLAFVMLAHYPAFWVSEHYITFPGSFVILTFLMWDVLVYVILFVCCLVKKRRAKAALKR